MNSVTWPEISITVKRCLHEVISGFFTGTYQFQHDGVIRKFNRASVQIVRRFVSQGNQTELNTSDKKDFYPEIAILGDGPAETKKQWTCGESGRLRVVSEHYIQLSCYVACPVSHVFKDVNDGKEKNAPDFLCESIWSNLLAAIEISRGELKLRGIKNISLPDFPIDISEETYSIRYGLLDVVAVSSRERI